MRSDNWVPNRTVYARVARSAVILKQIAREAKGLEAAMPLLPQGAHDKGVAQVVLDLSAVIDWLTWARDYLQWTQGRWAGTLREEEPAPLPPQQDGTTAKWWW